MKRFFAVACLGFMVLLLVVGCGQKKEEPQIETTTGETMPEEIITLDDTTSTAFDSTAVPGDTTAIEEPSTRGGN